MSPKKLGKAILCLKLESQVKRLRAKNDFKIVAVAGSVGKTSTKFAIGQALSGSARVLYQEGNYNDRLTVPLVLFGHDEPGIFNILGWLKILFANQSILKQPFPYDVAVLELGTDGPGQLAKFAYLKPDLTVITAIAAEHMEYFGSLDAVAAEELAPLSFSTKSLLNVDDIDKQYLPSGSYLSYGAAGDYSITDRKADGLAGQQVSIGLPGDKKLEVKLKLLGAQGAKAALAAVAVVDILGLLTEAAAKSLAQITPVAGRMQILAGAKDSTIIDDTYNASPVAVLAALEVLYATEMPQRIAILGSMNELGTESAADHQQIGAACDPSKLDLIVTIGKEAHEQLAPAAKKAGCTVESFPSPSDAGKYVLEHLKTGAVVLAKGSQNGVFAEEAVKLLLKDPADASKLVRQSAYWLSQKRNQFVD